MRTVIVIKEFTQKGITYIEFSENETNISIIKRMSKEGL